MDILVLIGLLFIGLYVMLKVLFFVLGLLFTGFGFLLKTLILLIISIPVVPVLLFLFGGLLSVTGFSLFVICGFVLFVMLENERRYEKRYR